jgi:hypothetical protein
MPPQRALRETLTMFDQFALLTIAITIGLFLCILLFLEIGRRLGLRQSARLGSDARVGVGVVDGSVYGLLALLLGFMFSGAAARFDYRRQLVAEEANAMGTAWERVDLLADDQQVAIRDAFRRYLDALIAWYAASPGTASTTHQPPDVTRAQNELWSLSVSACLTPSGEAARVLLLPSLNEMFGDVERERVARNIHPPPIIFVMLGVAAIAAALFAGYAMAAGAKRNWIYMLGIAAAVSIATYVILELEYPRLGLVRMTNVDRGLRELRAGME